MCIVLNSRNDLFSAAKPRSRRDRIPSAAAANFGQPPPVRYRPMAALGGSGRHRAAGGIKGVGLAPREHSRACALRDSFASSHGGEAAPLLPLTAGLSRLIGIRSPHTPA